MWACVAFWSGVFSMISIRFSSIVRTEGEAMKAMTGTLVGNLLNMILDPIFILGFKWGVVGVIGMVLMGVFAAKLDSADVRSNWIEQLTNAAAQAAIFAGILFLL